MTRSRIYELTEQEWDAALRSRRVKIGGSDIGALMGLSGFLSPADVYDAKCGMKPPKPDNAHMRRGRALEGIAVENWCEVTKREVEGDGATFLNHDRYYFVGGRPDRYILAGGSERYPPLDGCDSRGILEVKCPAEYGFDRTLAEGLDQSYHAQIQYYMGLAGVRWGAFAIFCAERWQLHHFPVAFNEEFYARALEVAHRFWYDHIIPRRRPEQLAPLTAIASQLPVIGTEYQRVEGRDWEEAMLALKRAREERLLAENAEKRAQERVQAMMNALPGAPDAIELPGVGKILWREQGRKTFNRELFEHVHPDVNLDDFTTQSVHRSFNLYPSGGGSGRRRS